MKKIFLKNIVIPKVLYVIGNGFDLAHNIKSNYTDFENWVRSNNENADILKALFSKRRDFWGDIETALGEYDEEYILNYCKPEENFDEDHSLRAAASIEDAPDYVLKPALDDLKDWFEDWVDSIDIGNVKPKFRLHKNAKFLSFNYIETLESIYKIPSNRVCHIHGVRPERGYVFGHNRKRDHVVGGNEMPLYEENAKLAIQNYMNFFYKESEKVIRCNRKFFNSLKKIKYVYVLGHSLSDVDMVYFRHLLPCFKSQPVFYFSWYSREDVSKIKRFTRCYAIKKWHLLRLENFMF